MKTFVKILKISVCSVLLLSFAICFYGVFSIRGGHNDGRYANFYFERNTIRITRIWKLNRFDPIIPNENERETNEDVFFLRTDNGQLWLQYYAFLPTKSVTENPNEYGLTENSFRRIKASTNDAVSIEFAVGLAGIDVERIFYHNGENGSQRVEIRAFSDAEAKKYKVVDEEKVKCDDVRFDRRATPSDGMYLNYGMHGYQWFFATNTIKVDGLSDFLSGYGMMLFNANKQPVVMYCTYMQFALDGIVYTTVIPVAGTSFYSYYADIYIDGKDLDKTLHIWEKDRLESVIRSNAKLFGKNTLEDLQRNDPNLQELKTVADKINAYHFDKLWKSALENRMKKS